MRDKESADAATGVAYERKRGVGVNPEAHVTDDVPDGGVRECGDKTKEFFLWPGFLRFPSLGWSQSL